MFGRPGAGLQLFFLKKGIDFFSLIVYNKNTKGKELKQMSIKTKVKDIIYTVTMPITHIKFVCKTKIMPLFRPHHKCIFYDCLHKAYKEGWYITDKYGEMIPWVHFDTKSLICLYPSMIIKIED